MPGSSGKPWGFLGKNTGVGCHFLLQGIFLTQGLNLCLWVSCIAGGFFTAEPQTYFISLFPSVRMQFLKGQGLGLFHLLLYSSCLDCSSINNLLSEWMNAKVVQGHGYSIIFNACVQGMHFVQFCCPEVGLLELLLLLLLSHIVPDSVWPYRWQPSGLPSLGFSRQEYWSGLPFPSPVHESEKWKWSRSVVSDSSRPHGLLSDS